MLATNQGHARSQSERRLSESSRAFEELIHVQAYFGSTARPRKINFLPTAHFQRNRVKMCTSPIPLLVSTRNPHKLREIRTILGAAIRGVGLVHSADHA